MDSTEDQLADKMWARFTIESGRDGCCDTKARTSCSDQMCRAKLHEDMHEAMGGKRTEKVDFMVEAVE